MSPLPGVDVKLANYQRLYRRRDGRVCVGRELATESDILLRIGGADYDGGSKLAYVTGCKEVVWPFQQVYDTNIPTCLRCVLDTNR